MRRSIFEIQSPSRSFYENSIWKKPWWVLLLDGSYRFVSGLWWAGIALLCAFGPFLLTLGIVFIFQYGVFR